MGPKLGTAYNILQNDGSWMHAQWAQYLDLFAKSDRRLETLNEAAGYFFDVVRVTFFENIVLGLARLTDPIQTGHGKGQQNLTLRRLPSLVSDPTLHPELETLTRAALGACRAPRAWRNKRLAHRDLSVALATAASPLPGISNADIQTALRAFRVLLNQLERHYWNSEVHYQRVLTQGADADALVYYLAQGLKADRAWRERLQSGKPLPEDLATEEEV
jgi:hypothetical protein